MPRKKQAKKRISVHEKRRKELSKLYIRPVKKSAKYTPAQQAKLRKEYNEYKKILESEKGEFKKIKTSAENIKVLKKMGYKTTKDNKVFIDKQGYNNVRITKNPHFDKPVIERTTSEKWAHQPIQTKRDMLKFLESYDPEKNRLPRGASVTIQIGENSPFKDSYTSYKQLLNYMKNFAPKDDDTNIGDLINDMELVYM